MLGIRAILTGAALAVTGAACVQVAARSAGPGGPGSTAQPAGTPTSAARTAATLPPTTTVPNTTTPPLGPPYPVGRATLTFTEPAGSGGGSGRVLPTVLRYPATAGGPYRAGGPYPLIVFSQGFDMPAETYAPMLAAWAQAGYVVADPTFPETAPDAPGGPNEGDIVNHPRDLAFVIDQLLAEAADPHSALSGLVAPGYAGVAGHSDGGDVTLAVAANARYRDAHVRAAVVMSGSELPAYGPAYFTGPAVPLLVAQGTSDSFNSPACSIHFYDDAPAPKYYLSLPGSSHTGPFLGRGAAESAVVRATTDFFGAYLKGDHGALGRLPADSVGGVASITTASSVPWSGGRCPGY